METMQFRGDPYRRECPTRKVLDLVGDKWTVLIFGVLGNRSMRFSELKKCIEGISQKMLTQTLRELERDGLVTRTLYAQVPIRVEYQLTELGVTLCEPIMMLKNWAETNISNIVAAQQAYDAQLKDDTG